MGSNTDFSTLQGGQWSSMQVNGSSQDLFNWLTKEKTILRTATKAYTPGLIKRGFSTGELTSNTGETVATAIKNIISHNTPGDFQKVLLYLLFACPWDPALTGHACLFLHKFCDEVGTDSVNAFRGTFEEKYSGKTYDSFKTECKEIKSQLDSLVNGDSKLSAVCHQNQKLLNDIWDDGKFDKYCDWLKRNLHHIIEALEKMSGESTTWGSPTSYERGFTAGPFLYGFVPQERTWQDDMSKGNLQGPIQTLTASLKKLLADLLFVFPWDDALTGHACLFLSTFCSKVIEGPEDLFQDPYKEHSGAFKDVCKGLKNSLKPFINGSSGLSAVCHGNTNLFESLWDPKYFDSYVSWLKERLHYIIEALENMSLESPGWVSSSIQSGGNAGPFKYGFVFNTSWEASASMSKLQDCISKLTGEDSGSLQKFKNFIFNPSTPSSAGATAGGVFTGLFGLGGAGAGAAYATNAFGFQNFISGLISSFLK